MIDAATSRFVFFAHAAAKAFSPYKRRRARRDGEAALSGVAGVVDFARLLQDKERLRQWPLLGCATDKSANVERGLDIEQGRKHRWNCCLIYPTLPWVAKDWCDCGLWGERPTRW